MNCPKCDANIEIVAKAADQSRIELVLTHEPDSMMTAGALGDTLRGTEKLLKFEGRSLGAEMTVFVESIKAEGNKVVIGFLVVRNATPEKRKVTR